MSARSCRLSWDRRFSFKVIIALVLLQITGAHSKPHSEQKAQGQAAVVVDSLKIETQEAKDADSKMWEGSSIPYPGGALYVERGICGAFLGGKQKNLGERQSLYQWQGELGYFYKPWFSGGVGFRIKAGEPSDLVQKIQNRYFLLTRFHKSWNMLALYLGPQLGLDNLNVLNGNVTDSLLSAPKRGIKDTDASLGLEMGGGWKANRWIGFTLGSNLEFSLVNQDTLSSKKALDVHINPGLAIDILAFSENFRELVKALYVNVEFQSGFLLFEKTHFRQDWAAVFGIGLAF